MKPSVLILTVMTLAAMAAGSAPAHAQTSADRGVPRAVAPPASAPGTVRVLPVTGGETANPAPPTSKPSQPPAGNMNRSARQARNIQIIGAAASAVKSREYFGKCSGKRYWYCVKGALAAAQAAAMAKGARETNKAISASDAGRWGAGGSPLGGGRGGSDGLGPGYGGGDPDGAIGYLDDVDKSVGKVIGELEDKGYQLSPDGKSMLLPDGRAVSTAPFADESGAGLGGLGLTAQELAEFKASASAAETRAKDKARILAMQLENTGGGGSDHTGGHGGGRGAGFEVGSPGWGMALSGEKKPDAPAIEGLSKKLGSDSIGVTGDDIFEMISRQYRKEESRQGFITFR